MRKIQILPVLLAVFVISITACQQKDKKPGDTPAEQKEIEPTDAEKKERAAELMKIMGAGEEHKILDRIKGEWGYKSTVKGPADTTGIFAGEGTTTNKMILENRFLISESQRKSKDPMAVGFMVLGYDRGLKKYTVSLYGEGGTYYVTSQGNFDAKSNTITTSGKYFNPVLKVTEEYDVNVVFENENSYKVNLMFKDKQSKSTFSGIITQYDRLSNPVR